MRRALVLLLLCTVTLCTACAGRRPLPSPSPVESKRALRTLPVHGARIVLPTVGGLHATLTYSPRVVALRAPAHIAVEAFAGLPGDVTPYRKSVQTSDVFFALHLRSSRYVFSLPLATLNVAPPTYLPHGRSIFAETYWHRPNGQTTLESSSGPLRITHAGVHVPITVALNANQDYTVLLYARPRIGERQLSLPTALAIDRSGNLYAANSRTNDILVYDVRLRQLTNRTIAQGVNLPAAIAFDRSGNLYVSNTGNGTITVYDPRGALRNTLHLRQPGNGVAIDELGEILVSTPTGIDVYGSDGALHDRLTDDASGHELYKMGDLAVRNGVLYATRETPNKVISVYAYDLHALLHREPQVFTLFTNTVPGPTGIAVDGRGNVYVASLYMGNAAMFDPNGTRLHTFVEGASYCSGVAVDARGYVYVANGQANTIAVYDARHHLIATIQ